MRITGSCVRSRCTESPMTDRISSAIVAWEPSSAACPKSAGPSGRTPSARATLGSDASRRAPALRMAFTRRAATRAGARSSSSISTSRNCRLTPPRGDAVTSSSSTSATRVPSASVRVKRRRRVSTRATSATGAVRIHARRRLTAAGGGSSGPPESSILSRTTAGPSLGCGSFTVQRSDRYRRLAPDRVSRRSGVSK